MASGKHFENFLLAFLHQVILLTSPKQDNRRKARQHFKISSRFNQGIPCCLQAIMPCLMPFDTKLRHLAAREPVGGR